MTIHSEYAFKKLLKFRTIRAFSSKLLQFRTKIENPENIGNCGRRVCGPDPSSCQTARTIAFGREQSATCVQTVPVFSIIFSKIINE